MSALRAVFDSVLEQDGSYVIDAPPAWSQGRTLYGGMTAALAAYAAARQYPDLPPLRSALFSLIGPAGGHLTFTPVLQRSGKSSSIVAVDTMAESGIVARSSLVYGASRDSALDHTYRLERTVPPPSECEPLFPGNTGPTGFHQNFERRLAGGSRPFTSGAKPAFDVWVKFVETPDIDPTLEMIALADSLPPAAIVAFPAPAPLSTMTWMIDLVQPLETAEWYLLSAGSEASVAGYSQQTMSVYAKSGARIAVGRQTVAIFV